MDQNYRMKRQEHRLSNKDWDSMTADCPTCGVGVKMGVNGACLKAKQLRRKQRDAGIYEERPHEGKTQGRIYKSEAGSVRIPREVIDEMKKGQSCAICGTTEKLCIDHCHKTGKIRGILCASHNSLLGFANDDPDILMKAIAYLKS